MKEIDILRVMNRKTRRNMGFKGAGGNKPIVGKQPALLRKNWKTGKIEKKLV